MQWKHAYFDKDRGHFLFSCLFHYRQVENNNVRHEKRAKLVHDNLGNTLRQGQLQRWTEHSTLIFENLKSVELSKNIVNII